MVGGIYDDVLDITWTQNAGLSGVNTWDNQVDWAANLSILDTVRNVTYDDWRRKRCRGACRRGVPVSDS
ncbi:MAG: hypothetical protein ACPGYT_05950 [Nitrospirales bacterium]